MSRFIKRWAPSPKKSFQFEGEGLKPTLEVAIRSIQLQIAGLENILTRLQQKDRRLFDQIISRIRSRDVQRASVLASELVQIRRMIKMAFQAKLALETIVMRMNTIKDFGEVVAILAPAISAIKSVKDGMAGVLPVAERSFSDLTEQLSSILVDAGQKAGLTLNFKASSEEAARILDEASEVAERMVSEKLPKLPEELRPAQPEESIA
ncbi:MAG: Snf7 family protein [Nitrososphaerota archaeon]